MRIALPCENRTDERLAHVTLGIRRISMLAMCLVVLTTTVGFACLVFAATAMGMPADHGMSNCGVPAQSAAACPHEHPATATATSSNDVTPHLFGVLAMPSSMVPSAASGGLVADDTGPVPEPPPAHITPLRI